MQSLAAAWYGSVVPDADPPTLFWKKARKRRKKQGFFVFSLVC